MNCHKCGDKVDMNAGHVCLTGNDRLKERITYLQARIAELEAMHDHQHLLDLADMMAKLQVENAKLRAEITEIAVKLWDEGGTGDAEMLARAYLPEPPREEK